MKKIFISVVFVLVGIIAFASDYSTFNLDNGQKVIIKEVHDNPIVIIDTWIKTGSINETDENNGAAHFLEHLFFKGTPKHPVKEFDRILEAKGAITNAATSKDFTHYYILIPSQYFDLALDLHSDMLLNPLIPRKELEKERKVVIEEIAKNNDRPTTILYRNMIQGFYKNHPYKRDVIGTKEVIETISREQILDFYNKWYTPQNMTTVIIGDVNTEKALSAVKEKFNKTQENAVKTPVYKVDKKPNSQIEKREKLKIETGYILIGFKGCENVESKDSYALDVLAVILGEGKSSKLYQEIKEKKQLVQSISATNSSSKDDSIFYISANYLTNDIPRLKEAIFNEIEEIKKNGITEDELNKAKNIIERDTYYSRESISNIAGEIGYTVTITGNSEFYKNYINNINKVSPDDVKRVAKTYLEPASAVISIVSPETEKIEQSQQKCEEKTNYSAKVISKNDTTTKYQLENGAILIITKNSANDIIAMEMASRGGNNLEKIPGTAAITADTILKGTNKYKSQELSELLEENGIKLIPTASGDAFSLVTKFTKNETELALDIFKEAVKNASLDTIDVEQVKKDKLISIKNRKNTPDSLVFDEFRTALWEGTPYGNTGKVLEKTIPSIQKEDVGNFYKNLFPAQNVVITINGNVNEQEFINYFSNLLKNDGTAKIDLKQYSYKYKPLTANKTIKIKKDTQAQWLIYGWLTDGVLNEKDWASLQVIDSILGSGMSSRLFTQLRDDNPLAYQVGSTFSANTNKGAFAIYIATNPNTTERAKDDMLSQIQKLKKEFVTDKELSEAKDKLLGNFVLSMETNMDKASVMNTLEITGRDYTFINKYPQLINSVSVQDIIHTANKYFSKPYIYTQLGPNN